MFILLIIFFMIGCLIESAKQNRTIIKLTADPINLAVTYYTDGQYTAQTDTTNYFVINQCTKSTGNDKYVHLNVIAPDNPSLNNKYGYPVLELSRCKTSWDATNCFIGSNYIWSSHPTIMNNITWIFESEPEDIYVRYRSYNRDTSITLLITYSNDGNVQLGNFTSGVIPGVTASSNAEFATLSQYIKTTTTSTVINGESQAFYFSLCSRYSPYNIDYNINVNVVGDVSSPLSAFDLIGCAYSNTPDVDDCTTANLDAETDQDAAPLVNIQMANNENVDLTQGVWLVVTGQGGNVNLLNYFTIDVTVSSS